MDEATKANINLFAILSNLPKLCETDETANSYIKDTRLTMQLSIKGGIFAHLKFLNGKCEFFNGKAQKPQIKLTFNSPEHLNKMFDGKANPGIAKGFSKIGFLTKNFSKLTDRLGYFLRPTPELLSDASYFNLNAVLTFHTAFFAVAQIANSDSIGKLCAYEIPEGVINIEVSNNGPSMHFTVDDKHNLTAYEGAHDNPRAVMRFADLTTAAAILNGQTDIYTQIGCEGFTIGGYIPMLDNLSRILNLVSAYVR